MTSLSIKSKGLTNDFLFKLIIIFCAFPYVIFIYSPMPDSYTQPFALITSIIAIILNIKKLSKLFNDRIFLSILIMTLGLLVVLFNKLFIKNILNLGYIAPFSFCVTYFALILTSNKESYLTIYKILSWSVYCYLIVGILQILINPSFLTGVVGGNKSGLFDLDGGRGTLSLASEPSYYAFQILIIASILSKINPKNKLIIFSCLMQVLLIARSTTAILTIVIALAFFLISKKITLKLLFIVPVFIAFMFTIVSYFLPSDSRINVLLEVFLSGSLDYFFVTDESTSLRLSNAVYPFICSAKNFFFPSGLLGPLWFQCLINLEPEWFQRYEDGERVMSGIGEIVLFYGFFSFAFLYVFIKRIYTKDIEPLNQFFSSCILFLLLSTFTFSNPASALCFFVYDKFKKIDS